MSSGVAAVGYAVRAIVRFAGARWLRTKKNSSHNTSNGCASFPMSCGTWSTSFRAPVRRGEKPFELPSGARAAARPFGLSSLLVCSECGSNYVQYGRTDYVCSGFHNGSTCANGTRFRIADIERAVLEALELGFLSPTALHRAADLAMEYFDKQQNAETRTSPELSAALAEINAREADVREQFKTGKLPGAVFKSWIAEFAKERDALNRPTTSKSTRISRSEFLQEYKSAVARRLKVFTGRENVAQSREALRDVLLEGRLALRPDAANARFEGTLTLSHEEFLKEKQVDIKMVAGAGFEPATPNVPKKVGAAFPHTDNGGFELKAFPSDGMLVVLPSQRWRARRLDLRSQA